MRIDISLQEDLPVDLKEKIRRQVAFKLGTKTESVRVSLKRLAVSEQKPWYVCSMSAKLKNGSTQREQIRGRQPNICVADTAARLARTIAREAQHPGESWQPESARKRTT